MVSLRLRAGWPPCGRRFCLGSGHTKRFRRFVAVWLAPLVMSETCAPDWGKHLENLTPPIWITHVCCGRLQLSVLVLKGLIRSPVTTWIARWWVYQTLNGTSTDLRNLWWYFPPPQISFQCWLMLILTDSHCKAYQLISIYFSPYWILLVGPF